jgi:hypothetical protein
LEGGKREMTKTKIREGVELIASDIPRKMYPKDVEAKISLLEYKLDWKDEEWMKVVDRVLDLGYDYFPKFEQLKEIHNSLFPDKSWFRHSCANCSMGLRRYIAPVQVFDFLTRKVVKREMPCAAACSSCKEGQRRHQEEGFLFYNDVMKRKDTKPMGYDESKNAEEVQEMVRNSQIGKEPEELPFVIDKKEDEEELPF